MVLKAWMVCIWLPSPLLAQMASHAVAQECLTQVTACMCFPLSFPHSEPDPWSFNLDISHCIVCLKLECLIHECTNGKQANLVPFMVIISYTYAIYRQV